LTWIALLLTRPDAPLTPAAQYLADCLVEAGNDKAVRAAG